MLAQVLVDTLVRAAELSLVAVGLTMTWGTIKFANVAHVQFATLGAYFAVLGCGAVGLGLVLGSAAAAVLTGLVGVVLQVAFFRRLRSKSSSTALIGSLALSVVITALIQTFAGTRPKQLPVPLSVGYQVGDAFVTKAQVVIVALTVMVLAVFFLVLLRTNAGRAVRCLEANADLTRACGIDTSRLTLVITFVSALLAGLGGIFIAIDTSASLELGATILLAIFAAVVMGGIGSTGGAVFAALILALLESLLLRVDFGFLTGAEHAYLPVTYRPGVGFVAVILVMLLRPTGIFGRSGRLA